jgi:hypothetical protein
MEMREAERDPHDGKRRVEAMWPIHKIHYQKNRWVGYALDSVCASTHVGVSVSVCVCVCVCVSATAKVYLAVTLSCFAHGGHEPRILSHIISPPLAHL